ncbi:hypothetical protein J6590_066752 [Homalodisca vitripennis]|nr:hypothetical protein J6590_066752 [Homalodisca vitripennis]
MLRCQRKVSVDLAKFLRTHQIDFYYVSAAEPPERAGNNANWYVLRVTFTTSLSEDTLQMPLDSN